MLLTFGLFRKAQADVRRSKIPVIDVSMDDAKENTSPNVSMKLGAGSGENFYCNW